MTTTQEAQNPTENPGGNPRDQANPSNSTDTMENPSEQPNPLVNPEEEAPQRPQGIARDTLAGSSVTPGSSKNTRNRPLTSTNTLAGAALDECSTPQPQIGGGGGEECGGSAPFGNGRVCEWCGGVLVGGQRRWCSNRCKQAEKDQRRRVAVLAGRGSARVPRPGGVRVSAAESRDGRGSVRRGALFEAFVRAGWPERLDSGEVSPGAAALALGRTEASVSRWMAAWEFDRRAAEERSGWSRSPEVEAMLADDGFPLFRSAFFVEPTSGVAYRTPVAHIRWTASILDAIAHGRRKLILSPPRHGKSDLLVHFIIWLICRNPNIRIMWVGGNEDIAKLAVGSVLNHLERNDALIAAVLGPGGTFKPQTRSGVTWSPLQLTVGTRTITGIKAPTLLAVGKGGKLLSRDADLIVADDIVDHDSVQSPATREKDHSWFNTQLASRKEEHTAVVGIGSRQHHQDLWGRLASNVAWEAIIEHAHDPACELPVHGPRPGAEHDGCQICAAHVDCLLFPEIRSFAWLQDQRAAMDNDLLYDMVYQNITRPEGADPVTLEHLQACRSTRRIGDIPPGCNLIAGHDPASAGVQGNVLWAVDPVTFKRYLVDLEAQKGGGTPAFRSILREWNEKYGCKLWVAEAQNNSDSIQQDRDIVEYTTRNGIMILPSFTTRHNKWSPDFGVPVQLALFKRRIQTAVGVWEPDPLIDIPFGDEFSRDKVRPYEQQVMNFEPGAKNNGDLLMAGWMPENEIRNWRYENAADVHYENDSFYPGSPAGDTYQTLGDAYAFA